MWRESSAFAKATADHRSSKSEGGRSGQGRPTGGRASDGYDPACVTSKERPLTRISAVRGGPVFGPALQEIELDPIAPPLPDVITSQDDVTLTTQRQSLAVDTLIDPPPPPGPSDAPPGSML